MVSSIAFFIRRSLEKTQRICLVHYHEIGLKGGNRSFFERCLEKNIKSVLNRAGLKEFETRRISGRILVSLGSSIDSSKSAEIYKLLSKIPGCARVSNGFKCEQSVEAMIAAGCEVMREAGKDSDNKTRPVESFKVSARRNHTNFELDSMELNQIVGGSISDAFPDVKVQMKNPSLEIRVEVIQGGAYIYGTSMPGVGGLPVGSSGKMVGMLSSGIDSPVAL